IPKPQWHSSPLCHCNLKMLKNLQIPRWQNNILAGPYCNATTDQIGTCWPRTSAGELVERPCPEFFNGIKYNTTSKYKLPSSPADLAFRRRLGTPKIYFH
uniref:G-protein coupled receptors family 2 profile 1 domain-containing protein n=1 Tax=Cyanistes caeruleus TaxID=156563 RepID=A0A8C0ZB86_CYACU